MTWAAGHCFSSESSYVTMSVALLTTLLISIFIPSFLFIFFCFPFISFHFRFISFHLPPFILASNDWGLAGGTWILTSPGFAWEMRAWSPKSWGSKPGLRSCSSFVIKLQWVCLGKEGLKSQVMGFQTGIVQLQLFCYKDVVGLLGKWRVEVPSHGVRSRDCAAAAPLF